jgi:hypothetical protein
MVGMEPERDTTSLTKQLPTEYAELLEEANEAPVIFENSAKAIFVVFGALFVEDVG